MDDNCPATVALRYAADCSEFLRGRRGRPRSNLFSTLVNDLNQHNLYLKDIDDLCDLKQLAANRDVWRNMFSYGDFVG